MYDYARQRRRCGASKWRSRCPAARNRDAVGMPPVPGDGGRGGAGGARRAGVFPPAVRDGAEAISGEILSGGAWKDIRDAAGAGGVPADAEFIDSGSYDYRCILHALGGVEYCSVSLRGTVYEK
ncbi:MAG: hypothetical protein ACLU9S_23580 [Oscillospiraceae bacterium]